MWHQYPLVVKHGNWKLPEGRCKLLLVWWHSTIQGSFYFQTVKWLKISSQSQLHPGAFENGHMQPKQVRQCPFQPSLGCKARNKQTNEQTKGRTKGRTRKQENRKLFMDLMVQHVWAFAFRSFFNCNPMPLPIWHHRVFKIWGYCSLVYTKTSNTHRCHWCRLLLCRAVARNITQSSAH